MTTYARDILWVSPTHEIEVWSLYGMKIVARRKLVYDNGQVAAIGPPWSIVGTGDFNGNGKTDILWHNAQTGHIQVWLLDGTRLAGRPEVTYDDGQVAAIGPPWSIVGTGDFNGNGTSDIVWYNDQTGHVQVWLLDNTKIIGRPEIVDENGQVIAVTSWSIIGIGDFNGDGKSDILWRDKNPNSPQVQAWWLNGTRIALRPMIRDERNQVIGAPAPWSFAGTGLFSTLPSRLQFRLRWFTEHDSNDTFLQGAGDETYLSAIGLDSAAVVTDPDGKPQAQLIQAGEIGELASDNVRGPWRTNPLVLMEFDLLRASSWPRAFTITLLLVEHDNEDVAETFAKVRAAVGDEIKATAVAAAAAAGAEAGAALGTAIFPGIGTAAGAAVGAAVGALAGLVYDGVIAVVQEGLANDVLAPAVLTLIVDDPERIREHPQVDKPTILDYRSKGAHYGIEYDWHLI